MTIVTVKEVSSFLNVKPSTIYCWAGSGSMPSYKIKGLLRFDMDQIKEWVKNFAQRNDAKCKGQMKPSKNQNIDTLIKKVISNVKK